VNLNWKILLGVAVALELSSMMGFAADSGALQAGAAKVEITPSANAIPQPFTSIHDPLYARAIYLDNGHDRAVF